MATERLAAGSGQGLTWGNAFSSATLNSLANAHGILSDIQIDNSVALDTYADFCLITASVNWSTTNFPWVALYLYPLNQDGTTYGDGQFGSSTLAQPPNAYYCGRCDLVSATQVQSGVARGILIPPGKFKFLIYNASISSFPASGNNAYYRTWNRTVA